MAAGAAVPALSLGAVRLAHAQDYPNRPIRLIVPFPPGGPNDVVARLVAPRLQAILGQPVVIENRPGAGGATGSRAAASAPPDGYTLLLANTSFTVAPAISKKAGYHAEQSFSAISQMSESCLVLTVPVGSSTKSVGDLVSFAKENPGKLNYGSPGPGNLAHLAAELFKLSAGIDVVHVPFKGGGEMVTAMLGEQVEFGFPDISIALPLIRDGKLRALAVTGADRKHELPEVPSLAESGLRDVIVEFWTGVAAPTGTPASVVSKLNSAIHEVLRSAEMNSSLAKLGAAPKPTTPEEFRNLIVKESQKWITVARTAGISMD
jgi:tripartite-type tricarboxylate transporter receptor subunit TctC